MRRAFENTELRHMGVPSTTTTFHYHDLHRRARIHKIQALPRNEEGIVQKTQTPLRNRERTVIKKARTLPKKQRPRCPPHQVCSSRGHHPRSGTHVQKPFASLHFERIQHGRVHVWCADVEALLSHAVGGVGLDNASVRWRCCRV